MQAYEFKVIYVMKGQKRIVPFELGQEALMFARQIVRDAGVKPQRMAVRAPWGRFVSWRHV